eukprot:TRINITY_DN6513_c0_g2_i1.p1 TRINITY_DN6513_c0_g2~~TRINITY_DN6513_c0_g2_i1.p1  ORF type:complete len:235 (-),score=10.37 TRINITY_DN6513_c0_g2_i1:345-1049(-)
MTCWAASSIRIYEMKTSRSGRISIYVNEHSGRSCGFQPAKGCLSQHVAFSDLQDLEEFITQREKVQGNHEYTVNHQNPQLIRKSIPLARQKEEISNLNLLAETTQSVGHIDRVQARIQSILRAEINPLFSNTVRGIFVCVIARPKQSVKKFSGCGLFQLRSRYLQSRISHERRLPLEGKQKRIAVGIASFPKIMLRSRRIMDDLSSHNQTFALDRAQRKSSRYGATKYAYSDDI